MENISGHDYHRSHSYQLRQMRAEWCKPSKPKQASEADAKMNEARRHREYLEMLAELGLTLEDMQ